MPRSALPRRQRRHDTEHDRTVVGFPFIIIILVPFQMCTQTQSDAASAASGWHVNHGLSKKNNRGLIILYSKDVQQMVCSQGLTAKRIVESTFLSISGWHAIPGLDLHCPSCMGIRKMITCPEFAVTLRLKPDHLLYRSGISSA